MKFITVTLLVMLGLLQYRLWSDNGGILQVRELEAKKLELEINNTRLEELNRSLSAEVVDLKTGLQAIEERARNEMGMIKERETFYQIVDKVEISSVEK